MDNLKVLVIDDDSHIRRLVEETFTRAGAAVVQAENGKIGLRTFFNTRPDLVILDIMMPEVDGWETCTQIRNLSDVPIIMLTALDKNEDVVRGLDAGADDFVNKPFNPEVLLARARAAVRRMSAPPAEPSQVSFEDGYLNIDLEQRAVIAGGEPVKLTPKEYALLGYLLENMGRIRTFTQILEHVWGWAYQDSPEYVHVYVSHLRRKIEPDPKTPRYIATIHGVGYRFEKMNRR